MAGHINPVTSVTTSTRLGRGANVPPPTHAQIARANAPYHPSTDTTTFKDLLLFEERLKMNAQMLRKRKRRYEVFLFGLVASIFFLAHRTLFEPADGLLAVSLVTLVLFFASGMYQERIRYANKYVPHANRALRSLNMHLNMRRPPRTFKSFLYFIPFLVKPDASASENTTSSTSQPVSASSRKRSASPRRQGSFQQQTNGPQTSSGPSVIPPIPPTNNPRGELIFSLKVDKAFKEGYERYRAAFERRREEKLREQKSANSWSRWIFGGKAQSAASSTTTGAHARGSAIARRRAAGSVDHTPSVSRQGTPTPGAHGSVLSTVSSSYPSRRTARPIARNSLSPDIATDSDSSSIITATTSSTGSFQRHKEKAESYSFMFNQTASRRSKRNSLGEDLRQRSAAKSHESDVRSVTEETMG